MPVHRPDDDTYGWERGQLCLTKGCENFVTFPDFEAYCTDCQLEQSRLKRLHDEQYEAGIRNWFRRTDDAA